MSIIPAQLIFNAKIAPDETSAEGLTSNANIFVNPAMVLFIAEAPNYRVDFLDPYHLSVVVHLVGGRELIVRGPIEEVCDRIWPEQHNAK